MDCWLCEKPVGYPVYVPTQEHGFQPAHRACAVAAITVPATPIPVTGKED